MFFFASVVCDGFQVITFPTSENKGMLNTFLNHDTLIHWHNALKWIKMNHNMDKLKSARP